MTPNAWDEALASVLGEADAAAKARRAEDILADRDRLDLSKDPAVSPADRPARPSLPALVPPAQVPRRGLGTAEGRAALLHALAHIELNAVDLAADMALRFAAAVPGEHRAAFVSDWIQVAGEEGLHFRLLRSLLLERGFDYGAFPAHDGLWEAAQKTSGDLLGRLAIAPMILEARGLDVTPGLIRKLQGIGDHAAVEVLERIYRDEIGHVRIGVRWFTTLVSERGGDGGDAE
ncbi:MAG: ferritin-like domain-containing protein, partial [Pseudomonadota bacterium]